MKVLSMIRTFAPILACGALMFSAASSQAAKVSSKSGSAASDAEKRETVELFSGMKSGDIQVKFIANSSSQANVIIKNNTNKPLSIQLPAAFAGVPKGTPVLPQMMGGGMGGMGGGMGGMGGGMFNVGPEKVGRIKVALVCLEHGKKDPDSRMEYEIRPIESFTNNPSVIEVCKMLARGEVTQNVAQAAAWNLANGLSWNDLAQKDRIRLMDGSGEKYFNMAEVRAAIRVADEAVRRGKDNPVKYPDAGKENSLSQR